MFPTTASIGGKSSFTPSGSILEAGFGGGQNMPLAPKGPVSSPPNPLFGQYQNSNAATQQQMTDYSTLNSGYSDLMQKLSSTPVTQFQTPSPYVPAQQTYSETTDVAGAVSNLSTLANTGGYSAQDIADLRARGISPIRSVYANAQQGINQQRALQGGYSPSYNATVADLARQESQGISDATQNVNAGIAQQVAAGKLAAAPQLAAVTDELQREQEQIGASNTAARNQAAQFNMQFPLQVATTNASLQNNNISNILNTLSGARSLYGTTPALSASLGSQALGQASLQNTINQDNNQNNMNLIRLLIQGAQ